ncbi:FMN-linked oxidoreductase [Hymenopellis radicata]|nr:FMN-linked oxidoreductase [Hymenopellis radicata]
MSITPTLFQPTNVGKLTLQHRVVLAPLTRYRATKAHVPLATLVTEYYRQRAHAPGTLLITEATFITAKAGGMKNVPGIWNDEQIAAWKEVTDGVHAKGSYIFLQLWALGRAADPAVLKAEDPSFPYVSASDVALPIREVAPRPLTVEEIQEYVGLYAQAAKNAIEAGFDGVEIHGANGYLLDQFTRAGTNRRTDDYGGSIPNRVRFPLQVVAAVVDAIGAERVGYRISPWNAGNGMDSTDPKPTFAHLVREIRERHPNLAYIHVVEPRMLGQLERQDHEIRREEENDFIREIAKPIPMITAGGFHADSAVKRAAETGDLVAFGRFFISNPDIVYRIKNGLTFTPYDRKMFYLAESPVGYIDYPFYDGETEKEKASL